MLVEAEPEPTVDGGAAEFHPIPPKIPSPLRPEKVSKEDHLAVENIYLKIENIRLQSELMRAQLTEAAERMAGLQKEMTQKQEELSKRYNVDMSRVRILPDGTIVPIVGGA